MVELRSPATKSRKVMNQSFWNGARKGTHPLHGAKVVGNTSQTLFSLALRTCKYRLNANSIRAF